jgi:Amt family ammonium transporter
METFSAGDTTWVMTASALVLVMFPGLAFFYGGLVRAHSVLNTLMMTFAALGIGTVLWVVVGYSLAFGSGNAWIGGLEHVGFAGVTGAPSTVYATTIPHLSFAVFQGMFAAITVALISGAVVERMRFVAFLCFATLWSVVVYAPLAHWVWGDGGWILKLGALDFAGGTVVHISAGTAAVVAALMLGRRRDHGRAPMVPHNVPFVALGAGLLWFGWFGFNGGSALGANAIAATAFATTHIAAAAGVVAWVLLDLRQHGHATAVGAATGAVAGLVSITPGAGFVTPTAAIAMGALGAVAAFFAIKMRARTRLDDALDVFACHGVAGIVGAVLTGVFASASVNPAAADGLLISGNFDLLSVQVVAVAAAMGYAAIATAAILKLLAVTIGLRVPLSVEVSGIDVTEHGEEAYQGGDVASLLGRSGGLSAPVIIPVTDRNTRN